MNLLKLLSRFALLTMAGGLVVPGLLLSAPLVRLGTGANATDLSSVMEQFRLDLGGLDNGIGGSFDSGFRAINWDGLPDALSSPSALPGDFFNTTSPRGVVFTTPGSGFHVSADAASGTPVNFGNIDPSYAAAFLPLSAERLFTPSLSTITDVHFFVPGQSAPAFVSGFGVVFADVDQAASTSLQFLDADGNEIFSAFVPVSPNGGLSFLGISGVQGAVAARITSGNTVLGNGIFEDASHDLVVMDDFIFAEPIPVPEPSAWAMLGGGLLAWLLCARCRLARR